MCMASQTHRRRFPQLVQCNGPSSHVVWVYVPPVDVPHEAAGGSEGPKLTLSHGCAWDSSV